MTVKKLHDSTIWGFEMKHLSYLFSLSITVQDIYNITNNNTYITSYYIIKISPPSRDGNNNICKHQTSTESPRQWEKGTGRSLPRLYSTPQFCIIRQVSHSVGKFHATCPFWLLEYLKISPKLPNEYCKRYHCSAHATPVKTALIISEPSLLATAFSY